MRTFLRTALVRGLIGQLVGWILGASVLTGIRVIMGLTALGPFFFTEPAWVFGGLIGVFGFIGGSGIADDWMRWARGLRPGGRPCRQVPG